MAKTKLHELAQFGQSIWLDNISRSMIACGRLREMASQGLRGLTSNPTIFDKAISLSSDYDKSIIELKSKGYSSIEIYDNLSINDVRDAADIFMDVYKESDALDGYVSLEIDPGLAADVENSINEGKRLFKRVDRPNLMIKVPATQAGLSVIEKLISQGINVNATLIFSIEQYRNVAQAFLNGMENLIKDHPHSASRTHCVASVFVSRIDTYVDQTIKQLLANEANPFVSEKLKSLLGSAAVSNCRLIYKQYREIFSSSDFKKLADRGAHLQRIVWASTSTKSPQYSDIKYVTELMYKDTVNTLPQETLAAFLDHGQIREIDQGDAVKVIKGLKEFEIDIDDVCANLLTQGVVAFENSFRSLLKSIDSKTQSLAAKT